MRVIIYSALLIFVCLIGLADSPGRPGLMLACAAVAVLALGLIGLKLMLGVANKVLDRLAPPGR